MVDPGPIRTRDPVLLQGPADLEGQIGERPDILRDEFDWALLDQEKPVATPGDVTGDSANAVNLDGDILQVTIAFNVGDGDRVGIMEQDVNDADRCLELVRARSDPVQIGKGRPEADGGVTAHAEVLQVVEKDDRRGAVVLHRGQQERADDGIVAARLENNRGTEIQMIRLQARSTLGEGPGSEIRSAFDHHPGRFTCCMAVDHAHSATTPPCRDQSAYQALKSAYCVST